MMQSKSSFFYFLMINIIIVHLGNQKATIYNK